MFVCLLLFVCRYLFFDAMHVLLFICWCCCVLLFGLMICSVCVTCLRFVCILFMLGEFVPFLIACGVVVCVYVFVVVRVLLCI